jgi:hypothetical protein
MWKGVGRSGIGDQTIIGEYEDWDGLSMNGRQWKSPHTQETRDLSGADYWHQRKALEPKVAEDIPTFVHGRANIAGFSEPVAKPKAPAKTKSVLGSILLADRNYERLCGLSEQLDQELDSGQITDFDAYCAARKNIDKRLEKAWARVQRERCWDDQPEELPELSFSLEALTEQRRDFKIDYSVLSADSVFSGLKDENLFKISYVYTKIITNKFKCFMSKVVLIVEEGLI